jgi:uncharacterized protein (TIGR02466 family)
MRIEDALRLVMGHFNAGRAEQGAGLCREILRAQPGNPVANALLARHLHRTGESKAALVLVANALTSAPDYPAAHDLKAQILADDPETGIREAHTALQRALILSPHSASTWFALGNLHQARAEQPAESLKGYRRSLVMRPDDQACRMNLITALLKLRHLEDADATCDAALKAQPRHIRALAFKTITHAARGQTEAAERLIGWGGLTRVMNLPVPTGFDDMTAFNTTFETAIRAHPNLRQEWDPSRRAIRGGAIVTDLLKSDDPTIQAFKTALDEAVAGYTRDLARHIAEDPHHPHLSARPKGFAIDCWANILGAQGHQTGHIHNLGWLSGVYYVTLPAAVREDDTDQAGWIEFNRPGYGIPDYDGVPLRAVRPEEGMLVLFPSYVWHRTIPFDGGGERISVAFDMHPR